MNRRPRGLISVVVLFLMVSALVTGCSDDATSPPDDGVVRGVVSHTYTDDPLAGATVEVAGQNVLTDNEGFYQFSHIPQGEQVLRAWAPDFQEHQRAITVGEWQSFNVVLSPLDTLVTVNGRVFHADDGNLDVTLRLDGQEILSDDDGLWSLDDVPMGPVTITVDWPPYRRYEERVNVEFDDQWFDVRLRREIELTMDVEHDSYIFTDSDSLNANRGQFTALWASPSLGRRALFLFPTLSSAWDDSEIISASLELHGNLRIDDAQWDGETDIPVTLWWLNDVFYENSVDFFTRPEAELGPWLTVVLDFALLDQFFNVDITSAYLRADPYPGVALSVLSGHAGLAVASSEFGRDGTPEALVRPRVRFVLAY